MENINLMNFAINIIVDNYEMDLVMNDLTISQLYKKKGFDKEAVKKDCIRILRKAFIQVSEDGTIEDSCGTVSFDTFYKNLVLE